MLSKNDCMSLLIQLEDRGINIDKYMQKLILSKELPIEVLQFIAQNKGLDACNFYNMLRKKYNDKKSPLYINIIKEKEAEQDIILTLSCLLQQIILYSNKLNDRNQFLKEARAEEITRVLNNYFKNADISECFRLLKVIKNDLLVLEYLDGRRELNN